MLRFISLYKQKDSLLVSLGLRCKHLVDQDPWELMAMND